MADADWLSPKIRAAGAERALKRGQALFHAGQRTVGLFEVLSGKVRLVRVDRAGREAVLHSAAAGELIAEASLFSSTYHCDAIATTAARVRLYPKPAVLSEFKRNTEAAQAFMAHLARQIMSLRTQVERRNIRSASDRIRHFLVVNAGDDGVVTLRGTLKELAADLGLTHEALYRTLAQMTKDGEIRRAGQTIRITSLYDRDHKNSRPSTL